MIVPANFAQLLEPGLRKIYGDSYKQYTPEYTEFMNVETSDKAFEEDLGITSLGLVPEKPVGRSVTYDEFYEGLKTRYTHVTYGLGFIVARELLEDDQYRKIAQMPKALARSVYYTIEIISANILNNAFSTSYTGADGKPLCAADHSLLLGGTFSNTMSTPAALSVTSFEQALVDIQNYVDDRGLKIRVQPQKLIVTPGDSFQAAQILQSSQLPGTPNNDINPVKNALPKGWSVCHFLTDPNNWFIITDAPNGLTFFWRRRPEFTRDNDFDSDNAKFKVTFRCSAGWTDPRGIYGVAPA